MPARRARGDQEVHEHDQRGDDQHAALQHRIVAAVNRFDQPLADPGPRKNRLGQDGAAQQRSDLEPDHGDDRDQGVAERVHGDDAHRTQALGARGADIVVAQHLQHRGTRHAGDDRQGDRAEHDRGQDQMAERRDEGALLIREQRVDQQEPGYRLDVEHQRQPARYRRPAERHREQHDGEEAPPEDRHRVAGERDRHHRMVESGAALGGGEDAGRKAQDQREQDRREREFEGGRKQVEELAEHRLAGDDRLAEVAGDDVLHVDRVLDQQRLIEPELGLELGVADRLDAALAGNQQHRVARSQPDQRKGEEGYPDEGRDQQRDARDDEAKHRAQRRDGALGSAPGRLRTDYFTSTP
jgi:hypothetical protein